MTNNNQKSSEDKNSRKTKTYAYWLSVCSAALLVVVQILAVFKIYFETKIVSDIISSVLGFFVVAGILIGPIKTEDDKKEESEEEKDSSQK